MDKNYNAHAAEAKWYQHWETAGYFEGKPEHTGQPYSVVIPPPNVTGILHMGHALNNTIQDVLVRWRRMQGRNTVWLPGTDHAGIATQNVVERALREKGQSRRDLGREKFLERVWQWRNQYGDTITQQLRKLGASCDWSRERFTMDEGLSVAVTEVFCRLYEEDLIYRGDYIVNWCPRCHTALSDEESEHQETQGSLWHISYPVEGGGEVIVATTRPETMLGDTAVAVNPKDERYTALIGKSVILPLLNRPIPIIADDYVDRAFGTGVVKITPAHDPNDFQVALRHNLPMPNVMHGDGTMNELAGPYADLDRFECRKRVIADLQEAKLLVKVEPHEHVVGHCYRCDTVVEPRLSKQWFVRMQPLAAPAIKAVRQGKIVFTPQRWEKTYFEWMENIRDWCISRQIWWGHRIPVYYCACGHEWAARTAPTSCPQCQNDTTHIQQDPDVLDTWFSSWLWPFSTFGWPENTQDLKLYYPTQDLATAPEILFFWVARMVMAGCKFMGEVPFHHVYLHGTVRDDQGRKMSKSLGNSIDPLAIIEQYSADALRFSLMLITSTGMDVYINMEKFEIGRNFATKIWNAARFLRMHMDKAPLNIDWQKAANRGQPKLDPTLLSADDRHMLTTCNQAITTITEHLENFRLQDGALAIYELIWDQFCDWYLEYAKQALNSETPAWRAHALAILTDVFTKALKLLHPYMPFLTEELWQTMGYAQDEAPLMLAAWPEPFPPDMCQRWQLGSEITQYVDARREMVTAGRALRAEYNVAPAANVHFVLQVPDPANVKRLTRDLETLKLQLRAKSIAIETTLSDTAMPGTLGKLGTIYLSLEGVVDKAAEIERLSKELAKNEGFLKGVMAKLGNTNFTAKAPAAVVAQQRERQVELEATIAQLKQLLTSFQS